MESTGSLLISQSKTHYRCYRVFIGSLHGVYMESTWSLLISQSKTHYKCYRVFIEGLHGVYMESTWSLHGVCLLIKIKPITGVTGCL